MEFTKFEKELMNPRKNKYFLIAGICCLLVATIIFAFGASQFKKATAPYKEMLVKIKRMKVETSEAARLKEMLHETIVVAEKGWIAFAEEKTFNGTSLFAFLGIIFIATYQRNKKVHQLICKLKDGS